MVASSCSDRDSEPVGIRARTSQCHLTALYEYESSCPSGKWALYASQSRFGIKAVCSNRLRRKEVREFYWLSTFCKTNTRGAT